MTSSCLRAGSARRRIFVPSVSSSFALAAATLCASPVLAKELARFDPIVITASRSPMAASQAVAEVTVLEREDLDRVSGQSLVQVLAAQPGVEFASTGGLGKTGSIFIRGMDSRHTLLLINGVRVGSATLGTPSLDNLPLSTIERIEIVRGPLSALYGSDAVGGVIQIFTRRGAPGMQPNAEVTLGSNDYTQIAGGVAFGSGAIDGAVQLQQTKTHGFSATNPNALYGNFNPDNDGFEQRGGSLSLGWQVSKDWRVEGVALESYGINHYDDGLGADTRSRLINSLQSIQTHGVVAGDWRSKLSLARAVDRADTLASADPYSDLSSIQTTQWQASWENTVKTPIGTALALIERTDQQVSHSALSYTVSDRIINSAALGLSGRGAGHTWQASLRHDDNSQFGGQNTGALGWAYELTTGLRFGASYGTSFVAPSFNQLYWPGYGNPDLLPEEGKHGEVNLRWTVGDHSLRAAWFDNRIDNFISSGPAPANVPRARIDGWTFSYVGQWDALTLGASLDLIDPRNATSGTSYGKQLARRAKQALKTQADWDLGAWSLGATVSAYSDRYDDAANTRRLAGYTTVDLRADYRIQRNWTLGARLNNLAGKDYETAYGYNQPGRELFVVLRYSPQ
ncbi:MAG: TonB-dependent receptor [Burkholderiaceae bacterium]